MKSLAGSLAGLRPAGYFPSQYTGPNLIPLEHQTPCVFSASICSLSAEVQDLCAVECGVSEQLLLLQHELFSTQTSLATGGTKPRCKAEARSSEDLGCQIQTSCFSLCLETKQNKSIKAKEHSKRLQQILRKCVFLPGNLTSSDLVERVNSSG